MNNIKVIAFDADDTLWVNEPYFRETEALFGSLMADFMAPHTAERELFQTEIANLPLYGYGIKGFMLSMVETALRISGNTIDAKGIHRILELGKELLARPIEHIEGVEEVLIALKDKYRLVVATKGDLLDQERKLKASGLDHYFHHIEIMSEKDEAGYRKLIRHLDIPPADFMMVGNSLKSDVLPVLNLGGHAVHVPFHITWAHEQIHHTIEHENFREIKAVRELLTLLVS
ncbi:putative hydrolase of the HAD superfamily [Cnuella takakiae]|uniref:Putative hydrolase of the HAD superfamily n=1 Tax=Cnuella takakiae TaxID=1302690 RepID=A0A1M5DF03_9BACT|nr:HAD family hydrolase [Cnuella takakiae]OLY93993.1 HAD family hydrolase [Cnuella takakiae]SHF65434.1 putative hydrolase of the HAD superfamily [Cnuella takakiae]